jgi:hypothetical protein
LAGVAGKGSAFTAGNPAAPQGSQVGFLEQTGSLSASGNLMAGTYTLSFSAAQRAGNPSSEAIQVVVDGMVVGTFTPGGTDYAAFSMASLALTAGVHTITFVGLDPDGQDNTVFLDEVALNLTVA